MVPSSTILNIKQTYMQLCRERNACRYGQCPEKEQAFFAEKKNMEWLALGAAQALLETTDVDCPLYSTNGETGEPESPDFLTYLDDKGRGERKFEITQALKDGYKQKLEHSVASIRNRYPESDELVIFELPPALKQPFQRLREAILKKAKKKYAASTTLLFHYNIADSDRTYDSDLSFSAHVLFEHATDPFLQTESFERVLILSADMRELVELHPDVRVIASGDSKYAKRRGSTQTGQPRHDRF